MGLSEFARGQQEILSQIESHLSDNCLKPKDAEKLRGRLQWYDTFLFGRIANYSLSVIGQRATSLSQHGALDAPLRKSLVFLKDRVLVAKLLELRADAGRTFYIFTDGAVEFPESDLNAIASVGGIIYNAGGVAEAFFSEAVPKLLLDKFLQLSSHPIFEVETLAALVAAHVWSQALTDACVVFYIDNDAAKRSVLFGNKDWWFLGRQRHFGHESPPH